MNRRGFTLVELLVGTMVMSVLGVALVRMLVSDSRFVSLQDTMMSARQTARGAFNILTPELRMISDGGVVAATPSSFTALIPHAFGITCREVSAGTIVAALLPPDSLNYVNASPSGMAWLDVDGIYKAVSGIVVSSSGNQAACLADSVFVVPDGELIQISGLGSGGFMVYGQSVLPGPGGVIPPPGTIFYLYESVTYSFAASAELPGRIALWRQAGFIPAEELLAPFDSSAGFRCLTGTDYDVVDCPPPGGMAEIRGLELRIIGASEVPPRGDVEHVTFDLTTRVAFINKVN